jgi:hypothetical protein
MALTFRNFTRKNIESVLTSGKEVNSLPSQDTPYLIIKLGPPGSGKSSEQTLNIIRELGVDPADAVISDIDNVFASFRNFRNNTRRIRNSYQHKPFNSNFYKQLSNTHMNAKKIVNTTNQKTITQHMNGIVSKAIKSSKHILMESTVPIEWVFKSFGSMLEKYKYKVVVIYHMAAIPVLIERIQRRGEMLYTLQHPYYRTYDPTALPSVIEKLDVNLNEFILPMYRIGKINNLLFVRNE